MSGIVFAAPYCWIVSFSTQSVTSGFYRRTEFSIKAGLRSYNQVIEEMLLQEANGNSPSVEDDSS